MIQVSVSSVSGMTKILNDVISPPSHIRGRHTCLVTIVTVWVKIRRPFQDIVGTHLGSLYWTNHKAGALQSFANLQKIPFTSITCSVDLFVNMLSWSVRCASQFYFVFDSQSHRKVDLKNRETLDGISGNDTCDVGGILCLATTPKISVRLCQNWASILGRGSQKGLRTFETSSLFVICHYYSAFPDNLCGKDWVASSARKSCTRMSIFCVTGIQEAAG